MSIVASWVLISILQSRRMFLSQMHSVCKLFLFLASLHCGQRRFVNRVFPSVPVPFMTKNAISGPALPTNDICVKLQTANFIIYGSTAGHAQVYSAPVLLNYSSRDHHAAHRIQGVNRHLDCQLAIYLRLVSYFYFSRFPCWPLVFDTLIRLPGLPFSSISCQIDRPNDGFRMTVSK